MCLSVIKASKSEANIITEDARWLIVFLSYDLKMKLIIASKCWSKELRLPLKVWNSHNLLLFHSSSFIHLPPLPYTPQNSRSFLV